jgi:hypothetical protein
VACAFLTPWFLPYYAVLARRAKKLHRVTYGRGQPTISKRILAIHLLLTSSCLHAAQFATVTNTAEADTFVRAAAPTNNYGGAGAIAVSGATAVNGSNQQNGLFDSLIRFPASNLVAILDTALGTHDWIVLSAELTLTEVGAPTSSIFNRGVGMFEVRWIAADSWIEGTGIPISPTTDGLTWDGLPSLLNPTMDASLGQFTNAGVDGPLRFDLALKAPFISDIRSGGPVDFHFTAVSPQIGFTAISRNNPQANSVPFLIITATINPNPLLQPPQLSGTNVIVSFDTVSNWNYVLQSATELSGIWSNVTSFAAQPTNARHVVTNGLNIRQRFYRLVLTP